MIRKSCIRRMILVLTLLGLLTTFEGAWTQTTSPPLTVCFLHCTYASIQAAIDAAKPGDTVTVFPAFSLPIPYSENIVITKPLTLKAIRSMDEPPPVSPEETGGVLLVPRSATQPAITIDAKSQQEVTITGFTFELVEKEESILVREGSKANLTNNLFRHRLTSRLGGWGIRVERAAQATIAQNLLMFIAQAIQVESDSGFVMIRENRFISTGTPIRVAGQAVIIDNQISESFNGIVIQSLQPVVIQDNQISGAVGAGISIGLLQSVTVQNNMIVDNATGIEVFNDQLREGVAKILKNIVIGQNEWSFAGITTRGPMELEISQNVIIGHALGVAFEITACVGGPHAAIYVPKITGVDNIIVNPRKAALCPADYSWPPGFLRK